VKTLNVTSPIGTTLVIDFEAGTISAPSKGVQEKILGWGTAKHEGKLCKYCKATGNKNIVINAEDYKIVQDALDERAREDYLNRRAAVEAAIPGLAALEAAIAAEDGYLDSFNRMMDDEQNDGVNPPRRPAQSSDDLRKQYPRAALYLKAQSYSFASNDRKSTAGEKAVSLLLAGGTESEASQILANWLGDSFVD
jgi:hypothetical protein